MFQDSSARFSPDNPHSDFPHDETDLGFDNSGPSLPIILISAAFGIAGGVIASDAAVQPWLGGGAYHPELASKALGAALVVALGAVLARRARRRPRDIVDLAPEDPQ